MSEQWVPKVHPLVRDAEPEDPLELMAEAAPGDPSVMLDCVLQEFAWMGYRSEQLLALFHHPAYPVLCQLREAFGDNEIRRRVEALVVQWGVLQFHESIVDDESDEPRLYQIETPRHTDARDFTCDAS